MPLPIIIVLERHWDVAPKQALLHALPFLTASGYNTLCFESPCEFSQAKTLAHIKSTITFMESRLAEAKQCLENASVVANLLEMDLTALQELFRLYVSTRFYTEMALWCKELPGYQEKLKLVKLAMEKNIQICGVDLTSAASQAIYGYEAQTNLSLRVKGIRTLDNTRIEAFKKNILALQQQGKGVIFVVGQFHYQALIEIFTQEYALEEVVFAYPRSWKCLDTAYMDNFLPHIANATDITLVEKTIYDAEDLELFLTDLQKAVQPRLDNAVSIAPTSTCQTLSDKTQLQFEAYARPSKWVDCYHFFSDPVKTVAAANKLHDREVRGFFTLFKNQPAYCVPNVNMKAVASHIQTMQPFDTGGSVSPKPTRG